MHLYYHKMSIYNGGLIDSLDNKLVKHFIKLYSNVDYRNQFKQFVLINQHAIFEHLSSCIICTIFILHNTDLSNLDNVNQDISNIFKIDNKIAYYQLSHSVSNKINKALNGHFKYLAIANYPANIKIAKPDNSTNDINPMADIYRIFHSSHLVVFDRIQNPNNLGAMLRVVAASGIGNVVISKDSVDCLHPKVISSAIGTHLRLSIAKGVDLFDFFNYLYDHKHKRANTTKIIATIPPALPNDKNDSNLYPTTSLYDYNFCADNKYVFIFSNEGSGISKSLLSLISNDNKIYIPMYSEIDSLSVVSACAICLFEFKHKLHS